MTDPSPLALFWAAVIAASILIYVLLDGVDIGVGILFGTTRDEAKRVQMMASIAPVWDGNETWLVVIGASLFAAFPAAYAIFLGAFYLPVLAMLVGLIFRGVAFEFRYRSGAMRPFWDAGFSCGSIVVAFVQGAAVGAMIRGIPVENMQYAGGAFAWLHPFPVMTGIGLVLGYALLGACWIVLKADGVLRSWSYVRIPGLVASLFAALGLAFVIALALDMDAARNSLAGRSWALTFPVFSLVALVAVLAGARMRWDALPLTMAMAFFCTAFLTLGVMFWPHLIPYAITVKDAAAPEASLRFFFYAGVVVLPMILAYTAGVYWVFRGKLHLEQQKEGVELPSDSGQI
ncbi:cytochrome d ubiquinol oxidase subunit II [Rhizobium leguminosarum]|uniref:Cytochrome d ubiquinol oxidase subunit II n=1 Tax=Rhizobium leguminosarum TaxID=384 RepID=A0A6P0BFJ4_RHILE|nr:cytochrome d ubiquinol oxidase subunit II [Rhizobium leguminosarum]MBY5440275.1 cytochrome d ubiquinol oxidase subunit II [Rhizobium leguminosarum]NEI38757.1 cytochrome d ubiquinol oxidase subunit II [Rhizobium leguminosarum]NEI45405.1 cytochrome d ubiquinol oxidase subunit II [Rhizobium leguminosarum]